MTDTFSYTPSEPWETAPDWAQHVVEPVNRHLLAPREARAVLDHVGALLDQGWHLADLLARLPTPRPTIIDVAAPLPPSAPNAAQLGSPGHRADARDLP